MKFPWIWGNLTQVSYPSLHPKLYSMVFQVTSCTPKLPIGWLVV